MSRELQQRYLVRLSTTAAMLAAIQDVCYPTVNYEYASAKPSTESAGSVTSERTREMYAPLK